MEDRRWRREDRRREPGPGRLLGWTPTSATSGRGSLDLVTIWELRTLYNIQRTRYKQQFWDACPQNLHHGVKNEDLCGQVLIYAFHKERAQVGAFCNYCNTLISSQPGHKCEASATVCTRPNSKLMRWLPTIILIVALDLRCGRYPGYRIVVRTTLHTNEIWNEIFSSFKLFPNQFTTGPPLPTFPAVRYMEFKSPQEQRCSFRSVHMGPFSVMTSNDGIMVICHNSMEQLCNVCGFSFA